MNTLWHDLVYGFRLLTRKPLFTLVIALSLAVGIGLNTAIFTLMNAILLRSLPFRDADRVVTLFTIPPGHPDQPNGVSVPVLFAWKEQAHSFEAIGALTNNAVDFGAEENGVPAERVQGEFATPGLLQALGAQPLMGRLFTESEDEVDHPAPVILISHRLWMRRFGGAKDILNRKVLVNGENTSIIGVMAPDFRITDENGDYVAPLPLNHFQLRGSARYLLTAARLKPGVTIKQAQSEMDAIAQQLAKQFPARESDHGKPWTVRIQTFREGMFGFIGRPLLLLQGAVAFVLLIACANVAALLMARASSRQTEVAIRVALGAGRGRIFRQFLTESLLLSIFSGVLGVWLAWGIVRLLVAMAPTWLPMLHAIRIDGQVLLFSAAISLFTGLIFGVIPAAQGSKAAFVESLKTATRGGTVGRARHRLRAVLVAGQLALALMLLIGSGLLIRSFLRLQGADLGCDPHGLLTFRYRFPDKRFSKPVGAYQGKVLWELSEAPAATITRVFERLQTVPGLRSVAGTVYPPLSGSNPLPFTIPGHNVANADEFTADFYPVTPNFFNTMKIRLVRGRDFTDRDTAHAPWVAIVNETMARRFFPNEDPIGKRIRVDLSPEDQLREIIAVVRDIPASHPQTKQDPAIFIPFVQAAAHSTGPYTGFHLQMTFLMRTAGDAMSALPAVRTAVAEVDRNQPLIDPRTEDSYLAEQAQYPRYYSMLLGLFAAVATGLAAVGIYGVMAYAVEQRTREIGIRMALGAGGWDVLKLIFRQALVVIAVGLAVGIAGATALTRFISSAIWEVQTTDPGTVAGLTVLLMAIGILACVVPTRRAMLVDPTNALRHE
ncbi:MAG TPA: ABC transporter permease [Candidatus Acidoferrales bacterium]|nr:ABC transporter permease [Candidatus Acidoferrales bacterium]